MSPSYLDSFPTDIRDPLDGQATDGQVPDDQSSRVPLREGTEETKPGETRSPVRNTGTVLVVIILFLVLSGILLYALGESQRTGSFPTLSSSTIAELTQTSLLDSRPDIVLMLEKSGTSARIVIQREGQSSWLLISQNDTTVSNPALSPDASQVAYLSKRDNGQIVISSVLSNTQVAYSSDTVQAVGTGLNQGVLRICEWTPVAWAPDNSRLAFFVCNSQRAYSSAMVAKTGEKNAPLSLVFGSDVDSDLPRELRWLNNSKLVVTGPPVNGSAFASVTTLDVP